MSDPVPHNVRSGSMYNRTFWFVFAANFLLVTANTLTFRFAEFVRYLGGTEEMTGRIVSFGLIGSLVWRVFLGQAIDRFGVRNIWILGMFVYLLGTGLLVVTTDLHWQIYTARIIFAIGLATMFSSALSFIQGLAPPERRTEIIGTFGASGFLGMICGAQLGDLIFESYPNSAALYHVLFGLTMILGLGHGLLAIPMTAGIIHSRPDITPPVHHLFLRYWPPMVLIVTAMMGMVFALTTIFLTRYATELGLSGIRVFFSAYAIVAFLMRLAAKNWSRSVGRHRLIIYGLLAHAAGEIALLFVTRDWQFIPASICFGFGHALLFPCVISLGAGAFPEQYRGTGTTIALAAIDIGKIITAPILGWTIDHFGFHPLFMGASLTLIGASILYGFFSWKAVDSDIGRLHSSRRSSRSNPIQIKSSSP